MNLAILGIEGQIAQGDSFHKDRHSDLRADFILAYPPFNVKDWGGDRLADDKRWHYGAPPKGNANFAWEQHIVHHLTPGRLTQDTVRLVPRRADVPLIGSCERQITGVIAGHTQPALVTWVSREMTSCHTA